MKRLLKNLTILAVLVLGGAILAQGAGAFIGFIIFFFYMQEDSRRARLKRDVAHIKESKSEMRARIEMEEKIRVEVKREIEAGK